MASKVKEAVNNIKQNLDDKFTSSEEMLKVKCLEMSTGIAAMSGNQTVDNVLENAKKLYAWIQE